MEPISDSSERAERPRRSAVHERELRELEAVRRFVARGPYGSPRRSGQSPRP